jgi:hypothetical protein
MMSSEVRKTMMIKTLQLVAILCTAVAMAGGWAHLLELPRKMTLSHDDYLTATFYFTVVAVLCIALRLAVFFLVTFPANKATQDWTVLPQEWETLRRQWEYSHAIGAVLYFVALASLALSLVWDRR